MEGHVKTKVGPEVHVKRNGNDNMPDPEAIKEILAVVSEKVPDLLSRMSDVLYGPDQAKKYATAIALFYKELKATGMTEEQAYELTKGYMSTLNIAGSFGEIFKSKAGHGCDHGHD